MTMGFVVLVAGAVLLAAGVIMLIVLAALGPSQKKKILRRMREKY